MTQISEKTARDIAFAYREIDVATGLLAEVEKGLMRTGSAPDIRDAFGHNQGGLQLGVPSGSSSHRLFNVPWSVCRSILELHIANQRAIVANLSALALIEASGQPDATPPLILGDTEGGL